MKKTISQHEIDSVQSLVPEGRYEYFVSEVAESREVWSLRNRDGWVVLGDNGNRECFPVWPYESFAAVHANAEWSDCVPGAIPLRLWMDRWLPGMHQDKSTVAVFPVANTDNPSLNRAVVV